MPRKNDIITSNLQRQAELLSVASQLKFPIHPDVLDSTQYCPGSNKPPREVYKGIHKEIGDITAFCPGNCLQIAALESDLDGFKWNIKGVYGYDHDGRPLGP